MEEKSITVEKQEKVQRFSITQKRRQSKTMILSNTREMENIAEEEVKDTLSKIKSRKAAGTDGIIEEFLKYGAEELKRTQNSLKKKLWRKEKYLKIERKAELRSYTKEVGK